MDAKAVLRSYNHPPLPPREETEMRERERLSFFNPNIKRGSSLRHVCVYECVRAQRKLASGSSPTDGQAGKQLNSPLLLSHPLPLFPLKHTQVVKSFWVSKTHSPNCTAEHAMKRCFCTLRNQCRIYFFSQASP